MVGATTYLLTRRRGSGGGNPPPLLPMIATVSAQRAQEDWGLAQHSNFGTKVYKHQQELIARYATTNIAFQRGGFSPALTTSKECAAASKISGTKFVMGVVDENAIEGTATEWAAALRDGENKLKTIAQDPALCALIRAFEGINEPQHGREGRPVHPDWRARTVEVNKRIWWTIFGNGTAAYPGLPALQHVDVLGPGLHDGVLDNNNGQDLIDLAALGIGQYQTRGNVHSYCGGAKSTTNLAKRVGFHRTAFGAGYPVFITEGGWQTFTADPTTGRKPVNHFAQSVYMTRSVLEMARLGYPFTSYEALDDPPPNDVQSHFGLWEVETIDADPDGPSGWTPKPAVAPLTQILGWLKDPGAPYVPNPIGCKVTTTATDLDYVIARKRNGAARIFMWRDRPCWDPVNRVQLAVPPVPVTVTDAAGAHVIPNGVGAPVVWLDLVA